MNAYAKAIAGGIVGFVLAFLTALTPFLADGGFASVTDQGWVIAVIAGLTSLGVTGGVVYAVPNQGGSVKMEIQE